MPMTATAVVISVAIVGVPPAPTAAAFFHSRPSRPIANMMRAPIMTMAFSIGGSEMSDSTVTICCPRGPASTRAASAAGSVDRARSADGSSDKSARLTSKYTTITAATPPIIERGMLAVGSRSSSEKYRALCHPPYVMTTACSANTRPATDAEDAVEDEECEG